MFDPIGPPQLSAPLRKQAEQQLSNGKAELSTAFTASADALAVLYRLSSEAITASDGLKLLHELQTYQVELDLQMEQLQNNERESAHELACYRQFFAMNPVACLILSPDGIITDGNAAANRLFGQGQQPEKLCGRSLLSLLTVTCQPMLSATLARVKRNQQSATLLVAVNRGGTPLCSQSGARNLRLTISLSPDYHAILIMLTEDPAYQSAQQPAAEYL